MQAHQLFYQRQSDAQAALSAVQAGSALHEHLENMRQEFSRNSDARVFHRQYRLACDAANGYSHQTPGGVNLKALTSRLLTICSSRVGSPSTQTGSVMIFKR